MSEAEYLTVTQAARLSGLSPGHIAKLLRSGQLLGIKPGHDWLVRESAVMDYIRQDRRPGRKPKAGDGSG
jgi:excisionase family DNA binding protein